MRKYRLVAKKGEGTFSEVLKAQNVKDGKYHAIKCMKNRFESIDQVTYLRFSLLLNLFFLSLGRLII
jgi:renal tumor antigen